VNPHERLEEVHIGQVFCLRVQFANSKGFLEGRADLLFVFFGHPFQQGRDIAFGKCDPGIFDDRPIEGVAMCANDSGNYHERQNRRAPNAGHPIQPIVRFIFAPFSKRVLNEILLLQTGEHSVELIVLSGANPVCFYAIKLLQHV
jgi:hypothetical protein